MNEILLLYPKPFVACATNPICLHCATCQIGIWPLRPAKSLKCCEKEGNWTEDWQILSSPLHVQHTLMIVDLQCPSFSRMTITKRMEFAVQTSRVIWVSGRPTKWGERQRSSRISSIARKCVDATSLSDHCDRSPCSAAWRSKFGFGCTTTLTLRRSEQLSQVTSKLQKVSAMKKEKQFIQVPARLLAHYDISFNNLGRRWRQNRDVPGRKKKKKKKTIAEWHRFIWASYSAMISAIFQKLQDSLSQKR